MINPESPGTTAVHGASAGVAADVMNPSPRTCSRFSRVIEAVLIFKDEDCGMVPVVEKGKPIGVVTDRDVALALATYDDLVDHQIEERRTLRVLPEHGDSLGPYGRQAPERHSSMGRI
jgi:CBS domain-containing protein